MSTQICSSILSITICAHHLLNPATSTRNFITILKWVDYPLAPCPRCLIPRVSEYHQDHIQVAYHGDKTKFFGTFLPRFFSRGVLSRHGTTNLNSIELFYLDLFRFSYPDKNNLCILKASCPRVCPFPPYCIICQNRIHDIFHDNKYLHN